MRPMRRFRQELPQEECIALLNACTSGVLALHGEEGYPYAVPLSYVYHGGKLYFHSAKEGHKIDAIRNNPKASFCVIAKDQIVPKEYTTYFESVIAFGQVRLLETAEEQRAAIEALAEKYMPNDPDGRRAEIEKNVSRLAMLEFSIERMTGKEAIELTRTRQK